MNVKGLFQIIDETVSEPVSNNDTTLRLVGSAVFHHKGSGHKLLPRHRSISVTETVSL